MRPQYCEECVAVDEAESYDPDIWIEEQQTIRYWSEKYGIDPASVRMTEVGLDDNCQIDWANNGNGPLPKYIRFEFKNGEYSEYEAE